MSAIVQESCREWVDSKVDKCGQPAVVILWGKLFEPGALGPRCEEHADRWLGRYQDALRAHWAVFDLRGLKR